VFLVDALAGVGQPELRETLLFVRAQPGAVSADEVAGHFRIHRTVARSRLERLSEAKLLEASFERRTGRSGPGAGRPAKVYRVPPEIAAIEFPPRHYEQLLGHLLRTLPPDARDDALADAGIAFAGDLADAAGLKPARGVRSAAERACSALGLLGFQARVAEASADHVVIETPTCPLRPLVVANPQAAAIDRGLWLGLVGRYLPRRRPCSVRCQTHDCLDENAPCRVALTFRTGNLTTP
jgi:predicted ArsR family transcriptional regulator